MVSFQYTIRDPLGIHARPAGMLAKLAKSYDGTTVYITKGDTTVRAGQLLMLMGLGVRTGDTVTVTAEGEQEEEAAAALKEFFENSL